MNKSVKLSLIVIVFGCIVLTGCKGLVIKGGRISDANNTRAASTSIAQNQKSFEEHKIQSFTVKKDVDVVFVKIKKEFGFWTEQELRADFGSHQSLADTAIGSDGFAYSEVPGVYYNMRKFIINAGEEKNPPENRKGNVMDVTIEKESANETRVSLVYWSQYDLQETAQYEDWIKNKLEKALSTKLF